MKNQRNKTTKNIIFCIHVVNDRKNPIYARDNAFLQIDGLCLECIFKIRSLQSRWFFLAVESMLHCFTVLNVCELVSLRYRSILNRFQYLLTLMMRIFSMEKLNGTRIFKYIQPLRCPYCRHCQTEKVCVMITTTTMMMMIVLLLLLVCQRLRHFRFMFMLNIDRIYCVFQWNRAHNLWNEMCYSAHHLRLLFTQLQSVNRYWHFAVDLFSIFYHFYFNVFLLFRGRHVIFGCTSFIVVFVCTQQEDAL